MDSDLSHSALVRFGRLEDWVSDQISKNGTEKEEGETSVEHIDRAVASENEPKTDY